MQTALDDVFYAPPYPHFHSRPPFENIGTGESNAELYGDSKIFAPDWFGETSPDNRLHTVDIGRFAYLPVMQVKSNSISSVY